MPGFVGTQPFSPVAPGNIYKGGGLRPGVPATTTGSAGFNVQNCMEMVGANENSSGAPWHQTIPGPPYKTWTAGEATTVAGALTEVLSPALPYPGDGTGQIWPSIAATS